MNLTRSINLFKLAHSSYQSKKAPDQTALENARLHIAEKMGELRGLPQKVGQILSMSSNEDLSVQFENLTDRSQALPFHTIQPILEREWGRSLDQIVESIDECANAASLGQVHKATLKDGREVAIKVRYPDIENALVSDLKLLGWLSAPLGGFKKGFDMNSYRRVLLNDFENELNYLTECELQKKYHELAQETNYLMVPNVLQELSTDCVLVSEWCEGDTINQVVQTWTEQQKKELSELLLRHFSEFLFIHGFVHADPHPGNYRFVRSNTGVKILLYDFGCIYQPKNQEHHYLLRLLESLIERKDISPYPLFIAMGFNEELLEPIQDKLPALTQILFEPFLEDFNYEIKKAERSKKMADILGEDRMNFRMAGPAELMFFIRVFSGLEFYLKKLDRAVNWRSCLKLPLEKKQAEMNSLPLPEVKTEPLRLSGLAQNLHIEVIKNGVRKASLKFPARSVDSLEELMGEEIAAKLKEKNLSAADFVTQVRKNGYKPQEIFKIEEEKTKVHVWLQ